MSVFRHGDRWRVQGYDPETRGARSLGVFATESEARRAENAWYRRDRPARQQPAKAAPSAHTLYRCFDADGQLLYLGIARHGLSRLHQHEKDKGWWRRVATISIEHHASRTEALAAESRAIAEQHPLHNVQGRTGLTAAHETHHEVLDVAS
jgi:predicted GIY-YIG superfamily endonuclease